MPQHTYEVAGMTCEHCVRAVTAEIEALDMVTSVNIDLVPQGNSSLTVTSSADLPLDVVRKAVQRAGYELVATSSR